MKEPKCPDRLLDDYRGCFVGARQTKEKWRKTANPWTSRRVLRRALRRMARRGDPRPDAAPRASSLFGGCVGPAHFDPSRGYRQNQPVNRRADGVLMFPVVGMREWGELAGAVSRPIGWPKRDGVDEHAPRIGRNDVLFSAVFFPYTRARGIIHDNRA